MLHVAKNRSLLCFLAGAKLYTKRSIEWKRLILNGDKVAVKVGKNIVGIMDLFLTHKKRFPITSGRFLKRLLHTLS